MIVRRTILAALAALAATSSLSAQPPPPGSAPRRDAGPDQEYVRQTLAASAVALAASRTASQKAQTDDIKEFAQLEEGEQETLMDVLKSLSLQNAGRTVRRPGDAEVEQLLDQRGRTLLEQLRAAPAGAEFDRIYMGAIATGHLELLRLQETYLDSGSTNAHLISVAKLTRTIIKEHLHLLTDIESGLEGDSRVTAGAAPRRSN